MNKIEKYLNLVIETNFPYDNFTEAELTKDYKSLKKSNNKNSNSGLKIVRQFHPSIWRCNRHGYKSPVDAWNDPEIGIKWPELVGEYNGTASAEGYALKDGTKLNLSDKDQKWGGLKDTFKF